ncbi:MAG TPA: metallophosphoesterase [Desulfurivibrionaceae bacterium]|nr:metallophosphoesterase [Desulfurivibrionaceae bacterium]
MATTRIGILSDTHLSELTERFQAQVATCFAGVDLVLHAGDLTNPAILAAFGTKEVLAVHGNMCDRQGQTSLPGLRTFTVGGFNLVLTHGHAFGYSNLEERLFTAFAEADCIVYGHTHRAVCHQLGGTLMLNPGSFTATGRHGAAPTYAILTVGNALSGEICEVTPWP